MAEIAPFAILNTGPACNNACLVCAGERDPAAAPNLEDLRASLRKARVAGSRRLLITGGEPTLHGALLEAVRSARAAGLSKIELRTNARLYCYPEEARNAVSAGITRFEVTVHGHEEKVHEWLTATPKSFVQTCLGIRNLARLKALVIGAVVLSRPNYRHLTEIVRLLARLGASSVRFYAPQIMSEELDAKTALIPRMSLAWPHLRKAIDAAKRAGLSSFVVGIPACIMPGYESRVLHLPPYACARAEEYGSPLPAACGSCVYFKDCSGPSRSYTRRFGWGEFKPVVMGVNGKTNHGC